MGRGDDFVARFYTQATHGDIEGIGSVRAGDAVLYPDNCGEFLLELVYLRPADE